MNAVGRYIVAENPLLQYRECLRVEIAETVIEGQGDRTELGISGGGRCPRSRIQPGKAVAQSDAAITVVLQPLHLLAKPLGAGANAIIGATPGSGSSEML